MIYVIMSLTVRIISFSLPKAKANLIGCIEFRGVAHTTNELASKTNSVTVNQSFIWPLARAAAPDELLTVELRIQSTRILMKTSSKNSSASCSGELSAARGTISSRSKVVGRYVISMQGVIQRGHLRINNHLTDVNNQPIEIIVSFEVTYKSPDDEDGQFVPSNLNSYMHQQLQKLENPDQQRNQSHRHSRSHVQYAQLVQPETKTNVKQKNICQPTNTIETESDTDKKMLLNIEQNIANLERNINLDNTLEPKVAVDMPVTAEPKDRENRRRVNMRTVRQFMKFGKRRTFGSQSSRDSSTDDDGRSLMSENDIETTGIIEPNHNKIVSAGVSNLPITSEAESIISVQSSDIEEGVIVDSKVTRKVPNIKSNHDLHLKSQDFQVCVTIIEARQLPGLNMDPVVCIQIGDQKKYTSVKESTNCPYYNEYFVFDFHMAPVMLFDKIITLSVLQSRSVLRPNILVGSFKLDVATVWLQKDHQFFHKWALLTDPDDFVSGAKGYLKCDIGIIGKGDTVKVPQKSEKDPDDIEANLLLPVGVPIERQRAKFIVKIYRADGLPRMNSSIMANMKRAFTGETKDLVSPLVQVSFAGLTGKTTVKNHSYAPVWNEQLIFTEMFPPLCQRIKIQLRDADPMKPAIIGTHYIDLKQISNDGEKGFLPTYGPSFINLYGSTRDYSMLDQNSTLNTGLGEGVSYRARLLIAIRTEITDNVDPCTDKNVELEQTHAISESSYSKSEEFFLFGTIMEASMIDRKLHDKSCYFELSMGNAGNSLDGHNESSAACNNLNDDDDDRLVIVDTTSYSSTTSSSKPMTHDRQHYYLPYWDYKPCMDVRCYFPDLRRRMFNSNLISKITDKMDEGLNETNIMLNNDDLRAEVRLRAVLEEVAVNCAQYISITKAVTVGPGNGKTKLDKERIKLCLREIDAIGNMSRNLRALVTKNSMRERYITALSYLQKLIFLIDDPQHSLPDIFVWLVVHGKRIAYHRVKARDLIYSSTEAENGAKCGRMQTVILKLPGKQANSQNRWGVQVKLSLYLWLGVVSQKKHFYMGLPKGYDMTTELRNSERVGALAPSNLHYVENHVFQLRAHIYQARSLIGSDASGLSDPYACVYITEFGKTTQVIEETLSPTWDELLVINDILVYGNEADIHRDPPTVVVEIYDQDKVGKSEFIGRTIVRPRVMLRDDPYIIPTLEWFDILRGTDGAGELLAAFELLEVGAENMPTLTEPKEPQVLLDAKTSLPKVSEKCSILPVPRDVRPNLARFRVEVLFWGLRDLKRVHFMSVDKPRIDIECSGTILNSSIIQNAKRNPNFFNMLKFFDLELPVEENYAPPITIRCVDCRSFGRYTLVGTHQITSIHKYMHRPLPREEFKSFQTTGGQIVLKSPVNETDKSRAVNATCNSKTRACDRTNKTQTSSCENLASYGAICVGKSLNRRSQRPKPPLLHDDTLDPDDDYENVKDWWTKYFWSYEKLILESKEKNNLIGKFNTAASQYKDKGTIRLGIRSTKSLMPSPKHLMQVEKNKASTALFCIYSGELESAIGFNNFKDWLLPFPLYRGKKTGDFAEDDNRIVGFFKGAIKVYRLPLAKGVEPAFALTLPTNDPIHVLVRVYIVKATDLHPMDLNGKADPYVVLQLGNKRISDKDNYVSKQLNPVFGKCFEIEATFPQDSLLTIQVLDWDLVGSDDLIGETRIDLENRFYSKHRATCGLARRYEETGYNRWRDPMKPTQILQRLCKENKLEQPHYFQDRVVISRYCMTFSEQEVLQWNGPLTSKNRDEHLALAVLHRWHEMPRIGCFIVPEHIESRPLYNPDKAGIEQGKLELWVDMFPMDMPLPGPSLDISPRKPKSYELRIVIWNTDDVLLEDDAFFTGEKMSDIYVKGWLKGPQDVQATDIHYRSLTGEGNFNWRFIYPFEYLAAEERIVLTRRESMFSWDETEVKIPARLELQVWDADHFSADDFLGAISLNLNRFPRGAKSSKLCTLDMLNTECVPTVNIFKQKRVRGWWPFYVKKENDEMELTGKVEAEIHLLTKEEAEQNPAGFGRNEPDGLEKPNRPDASFMWFLNPLKSIRYIVWHNYKWVILKSIIVLAIFVMFLLFFYAIPGYTVKRMIGA